jgi:DNA repair protein RadC
MSTNISIKNWAKDDRPREKALAKGFESLSNTELIGILLRTGTKEESAIGVARLLLDSAGNNLNKLAQMNAKEISKIKGIGETKAITLLTALELGKRRKSEDVLINNAIRSSSDANEIFYPIMCDLPYEEFWILLLSRSNSIISKQKISQGGISGTITDVRLILKSAIDNMASGLILCHNHPSGNLKPSEQDIALTQKLKEAAKLMDINVLDHIIVTNSKYFSFADEGIL